MPAHTGRGEAEEGSEHVRGASSVDDWADVRWLYTKAMVNRADGTTGMHRFLRAEQSRGVDVGEQEIAFEKEDNLLYVLKSRSRSQARSEGAAYQVVRLAIEMPGIKSGDLSSALTGDTRIKRAALKEAERNGWVRVEKGDNNSKLHYATEQGIRVVGES